METRNWTTEDWKAFFVRWEDEQYHRQNLDLIDEYYSPGRVEFGKFFFRFDHVSLPEEERRDEPV